MRQRPVRAVRRRLVSASLIAAAVCLAAVRLAAGQAVDPVLATSRIIITGGGITIRPAHHVVPRNVATAIETVLEVPGIPPGSTNGHAAELAAAFPADAVMVGELIGPSLGAPVALMTRPGQPFRIQPLAIAGLHFLRNIRLVSGVTTLLGAQPDAVTIEVIDRVLVSQVTSRPLTAEEIRNRGIVVDQTNYQAVNFSAAFGFQGREVTINFPMIVPNRVDATLAPAIQPIELPALQPTTTPVPTVELARLVEAFETPNVTVGGLLLRVEDEEIERAFSIPALSGVIVIPGNIAYLNQFFSILTMVSNAAPGYSNLSAQDVRAEIVLPAGTDTVAGSGDDPLRMARLGSPPTEQSRILPVAMAGPDGRLGTADDVLVLAPQQSGNSEHLVEGVREGVHTVEIRITAMLHGLPIGPVPISGRVLGTVEVRNPTFALTLSHPATVTAGEEYDLLVTVTNTSTSPANLASVNLLPRSISGATLLSSQSVQIETIAPGDSETVSFRLLSQTTGTVTATSFSSDGIPGRFELRSAVGALGIPTSPNTLVLPEAADALPASLRAAGVGFLGQAFALATSPVAPRGLLPITQQIVYDRATLLAQAGQRLGLQEPIESVIRDLLLDWSGSEFARLAARFGTGQESQLQRAEQDFRGFDELLRQSRRGQLFMEAAGAALGAGVHSAGVGAFLESWARDTVSRAPQVTALVVPGSADAPIALQVLDPAARLLGHAAGTVVQRSIPFGSFVPLSTAGAGASGELAMVATPQNGVYEVALSAAGAGVFDFGLVVPDGLAPRRLLYSGVSMNAGARAHVRFTIGSGTNSYALEIDEDGDGDVDRSVAPSASEPVGETGPRLISAVQIVTGRDDPSRWGQLIALVFSEEISRTSSQDGLDLALLTHYQVEANQVLGASLQPGGRVVLLSLRDGVGPFATRTVTVSGIEDPHGFPMTPSPTTVALVPTIQAPGGRLAGRVLKGAGSVVPRARIRLRHALADGEVTLSVKDADANGEYAFDYVPLGGTRLEAFDPDTSEHGDVRLTLAHHGQRLDVDIVLLGTGTVAGRALSPAGAPLRDAVVRAQSLTRPGEIVSALTDASGAFVLAGIPVGNFTLEAAHVATNARALLTGSIPTAGAVIVQNLTLVPLPVLTVQSGTVAGQVFRADGTTPAVGVTVSTNRGGIATTGAAGTYRIELLPVGEIVISAIDQARFEQATVATSITANATTTANLRLVGGTATVRGVVVDPDGARVAGARVYGGPTVQLTNTLGEFELIGVPLGSRTITAVHSVSSVSGVAAANLNVPGETVDIQIVLQSFGSIAGRIFDADRAAVPGLRIFLLGPVNLQAVTGPSGGYRFDNVPVGTYQVSAFRPDFSDGEIAGTRLSFNGEVRIADVTFRGKGRVTGTVRNAAGTAALGATVGLSELRVRTGLLRHAANTNCFPDTQVGDITVDLPECETVGIGFRFEPRTRIMNNDVETGTFTFDDVFVGPVTVEAASALSPAIVSSGGSIQAAHHTLDLELRLTSTSTVGGTVFMPDGQPAGADVVVTLNGRNVVTDAAGRFTHFEVVPGGFSLTASDPASGLVGQSHGTVAPGVVADVPVRLLGTGSVSVEVRGANGVIADALVRVRGGRFPNDEREAFTGANGRVTFAGGDALSEGPFSASAFDQSSGVTGFASGTIVRDAQVDVTVQLPDEAGAVQGRFLSASGAPVPNAQIRLASAGGEAFATTFADGSFGFQGVRLGAATVEAFDPVTARRGRSTGTVSSHGQLVTIDVHQVPQGSVHGAVRLSTDSSAVGSADVTLSVNSVFGGQFRTTSALDGTFSFPGVSAGTFNITAFDPVSGFSGSASGSLASEGQDVTTDVVLQVPARGRVEGFVTTAAGATAGGAQVSFGGRNTTADNAGFYFFDDVPVGAVTVLARPLAGPDGGRADGSIAFAGEVLLLNVRFVGVGSVSGIVRSGGELVQLSTVSLSSRNASGRGFSASTQTNSQGAFSFASVPVGDVSVTAVEAVTGLAGSASGALAADGSSIELQIDLQPSAGVRARVVRETGLLPAAGMAVELIGTSRRYGMTGQDGVLHFDDLALGTYQIQVTDPLGDGIGRATAVLDEAGEVVDLADLLLDEFRPRVVSIVPASGAAQVPVNSPIVVTFSEPIAPSTITNSNLLVATAAGLTAGIWTTAADGRSATFMPAVPFADFTPVSVRVTTAVQDRVGRTPEEAFVSGFQTADSVPPSFVSFSPASGAVGIVPEAVVRVAYSEAINPAAFPAPAIEVRLAGLLVAGQTAAILNNTVVVFTPAAPLQANAVYSVLVRPATDVFGNVQLSGSTFSFSTIDTLAPVIELTVGGTTAVEGTSVLATAGVGTATDVASVEFLVNGAVVRTDSAAPFDASIQVTPALRPSFTLSARATDTSGNIGPTASVTIAVETDGPPTVEILSPAAGSQANTGSAISLRVRATDDRGVSRIAYQVSGQLTLAGAFNVVPAALSTETTFTIPVPASTPPGPLTLRAASTDVAGVVSPTASIEVTVADATPPTVQILAPAAGAHVNAGRTVEFLVSAADNASVASLQFEATGAATFSENRTIAPALSSTQQTFAVAIPASAAEGDTLAVAVRARDGAGNDSLLASRTYTVRGPSGSVRGTVFAADGSTPVSGFVVRLTPGLAVQTTTAASGGFVFDDVPLDAYGIDVLDGNSRLRGRVSGILVSAAGEVVTRDVTLIATGSVAGQVFNPDGSAAPNISVVVQSANPTIGGAFNSATDATGRYQLSDVPIGTLTATATDAARQLSAQRSGQITANGQEVTLDIQLAASTDLPANRYDANNFLFDIRPSGAVIGTRSVFAGDAAASQGGAMLDIVLSGTATMFSGAAAGAVEENGREIAIRQQGIAGLDVQRKIFVPRIGYFARYLETLSNPGTSPVTVDVRVSSHLTNAYGAKQIVNTSNGNALLEVGAATPDRWVVIDDSTDADPFLTDNLPASAFVFDGPSGATASAAAGFGPPGARLSYEWTSVTVPPGGTVAFLHFVVQQTSRAAAEAAASRLAQLPPEALAGLSAEEALQIRNFAVPADRASSVAALPALEGTISGRVLAADGTTPIGNAPVRFQSDHILFGRTYTVQADANGVFSVNSVIGEAADSRAVPIDGFMLRATDPATSVLSPLTHGTFPAGQATATVDVIFSGTAVVHGIVRMSNGAAVGAGSVQVSGGALAAPLTAAIGNGGSYQFTGLLPGSYTVVATIPHAQGTPLTGAAAATVAAGQDIPLDITIQAGSLAGTVTRAGSAVPNVPVQLAGLGFLRATTTNQTGAFSFPDVPPATFTLSASEAATFSAASVPVTVTASQTLTQDLALTATHFRLDTITTGTGAGTVTSTPAGISCGVDCTEMFPVGAVVNLTAIPMPGSRLVAWEGVCAGTTGHTCTMTLDGDRIASARFELLPSAECLGRPSGLVNYWPGDGDAIDMTGPNNGTFIGDAATLPGFSRRAFSFGGNGAVVVPNHPGLNPTRQLTISAWVNPAALTSTAPIILNKESATFASFDDIQYQIGLNNGGATGAIGNLWIYVGGLSGHPGGLPLEGGNATDGGGVIPLNQWSYVALTVDLDAGFVRTYINGVVAREYAVSPALSISQRSGSLKIGNRTLIAGGWNGLIDEVGFFNRALGPAEVQAVFAAGGAAICKGTTFDATADFSVAANPNGVWTYGEGATLGAFVPFAQFTRSGLAVWQATPGSLPAVAYNDTSAPIGIWPSGRFGMHPGPGGEFAIVRWTAPSSSQYALTARFAGGDTATTDVHVLHNGQSLFDGAISGQGDLETFTGVVSIQAGATIDFVVGAGGNGYFFDTTFLDASISTPNPALSVARSGSGDGSVTSSPGGIGCGVDCFEVYELDTPVTLTAVPAADSTFEGFGGDCHSTTATTCSVTIAGPRQVTAVFRSNSQPIDSDGDGLSDAEEAALGSNPNNPDSDGDGVLDGVEATFGADPASGASVPAFKQWTGATSTNWSDGSNWSPAGAPVETDNVWVPASAVRPPALTASVSIRHLFVQTGIEVETAGFTLTSSGNVHAEGIQGAGTLRLTGSGVSVRGRVPNLIVAGAMQFSGTTTVRGDLVLNSVAEINGQLVTVTGNLNVTCGPCTGQLRSTVPGGRLRVTGSVHFDGQPTSDLLTAGTLEIGGNFFTGGTGLNFVASGSFTVVFNGTAPQQINFCCGTGPADRRFQHLEIANPAGVSVVNSAYVSGALRVRAGAVLTGAGTITVAGDVITESGSSVTISTLGVRAVLAAAGTFSPQTTRFQGANQTIPGGLAYRSVAIDTGASAAVGGPATFQGDLTVNGVFEVNGQTVTVTGSMTSACGPCTGQLRSTVGGGLLRVIGSVVFDGQPTTDWLTAGALEVGGNFTAGGTGANFVATGTYTVVFNGTSAQQISFCCGSGPADRRFQHLEIANAAGVSLVNSAYVSGRLRLRPGAALTGPGTLAVAGDVTTDPGSSVTVGSLGVRGVLTAAGAFSPGTTRFQGMNQTIPGGLGYRNVAIDTGATTAAAGAMTIQGDLTVNGTFEVNGQTVTVTGGLFATCGPCTGQLRSTVAGSLLRVAGSVAFDGQPTTDVLTTGTLEIGGNFFAGGTGANFIATGDFTVVFNGSTPQEINFCCGSNANDRRFRHLDIANSGGVSVVNHAYASGQLRVRPNAVLTGPGTLTVAGNVTTDAGSNVTVNNLGVGGVLVVTGGFSPATLRFSGTNQIIPAGLAYRSIVVETGASTTVGGTMTLQGDLVVNGVLELNGQMVTVAGNLNIFCGPCTGQLRSTVDGALLRVAGNVTFDGLSTAGFLTTGTLEVGGTFFVGGSHGANFVATGSFRVVLNGTAPQQLNFCCGSDASSRRLANLELANPAGVVLVNHVYISGTVTILDGTVTSINGAPATIAGNLVDAVGDRWQVATTTFTGSPRLPSRVRTNGVFTGVAVLQDDVELIGGLTLHGQLDVNGRTLSIGTDLNIPCGPCTGLLVMTNPAGLLTVGRDVNVDGRDTSTSLAGGTLRVGRNFFIGGSNGLNFAPTLDFTVVFNGPTQQSFTSCCGLKPFRNVIVETRAGLLLNNDMTITGTLGATGTSSDLPLIIGQGRAATASSANVNGLVLDNVALTLDGGPITAFDHVTFRNYPADRTQLTIRQSALNLAVSGLQFLSTPGSGWFIRAEDTDGPATPSVLTLVGARPLNGSPRTTTTGGFVINWGNADDDTDGDGLTDVQELTFYPTDPLNADSDGDGISDGQEIALAACVPPAAGLVGWWPGDGSVSNLVHGGPDGALMIGAGFGPAFVDQGFVNLGGTAGYVRVPHAPELDVRFHTLANWVNVQRFDGEWAALTAVKAGAYGLLYNSTGRFLRAHVWLNESDLRYLDVPYALAGGKWGHVAQTYDSQTGQISIYVNGVLVGSGPGLAAGVAFGAGHPVLFGRGWREFETWPYAAMFDEVQIYNRALTPADIRGLFDSLVAGTCRNLTVLPGQLALGFVGEPTSDRIITTGGAAPSTVQVSAGTIPSGLALATNGALSGVPAAAGSFPFTVTATDAGSAIASRSFVKDILMCLPTPLNQVARWRADGNAADAVGSNPGTLQNGVSFASGRIGQAFSFDGLDDSVLVANAPALNPTAALTIEAWVWVSGGQGNHRVIFGKDNVDNEYLLTVSSGNRFRPHVGLPAGWHYFDGGTTVQTNRWYHVAMTYDGAAIRIYVDGRLDGTMAASGPININASPVRIGGIGPGSPYNFNGLIDEVSFYNRALTPEEIRGLYLSGAAGKCTP